jgi:hypothetical protein
MSGIGLASALGGYFISQAYRSSEAALIAPVEYIALVLAIIFGIIFFGEWPDSIAWVGILLILSGGLLMLWRVRNKKEDYYNASVTLSKVNAQLQAFLQGTKDSTSLLCDSPLYAPLSANSDTPWALLDDIPACAINFNQGDPDVDHTRAESTAYQRICHKAGRYWFTRSPSCYSNVTYLYIDRAL